MTDAAFSDHDLAADYVLGIVPTDQRADLRKRVAREPGFAKQVLAWEERFADLNQDYPVIDPPASIKKTLVEDLFEIEDIKFSVPRFCGGVTAGFLLGLFMLTLAGSPDTRQFHAFLTGIYNEYAFAADVANGVITVEQIAGAKPDDQSLELWIIEGETDAKSIGLLGDTLRLGELEIGDDVVLAISLEPEGGSVSGLPDGPIIATGPLEKP